jgi:transcriptional regulator with XRE-family HTH domain
MMTIGTGEELRLRRLSRERLRGGLPLVSLLNWLGRHGYRGDRLAEFLGVSRAAISRWRSGKNKPNPETLAQMKELKVELGKADITGKPVLEVNNEVNKRSTKSPFEYEKMPIPIYIDLYNNAPSVAIPSPTTSAPVEAPSGEADVDAKSPCARCPLKGKPR